MDDLREEEELIDKILKKNPHLTRATIEDIVARYMSELDITRKTALYLLLLESGSSYEGEAVGRLKIGDLIAGLSNVHLVARVAWIGYSQESQRGVLTRGGLVDDTGVIPVVFWGRDRNDLAKLGVRPGEVVDIQGCYVRENLQGELEVHVPQNATISPYQGIADEIPFIDKFMKPVNEASPAESPQYIYGILLTRPSERVVMVNQQSKPLYDFYIGAGSKAVRCISWSRLHESIYSINPGEKIRLYHVWIRENRFGDVEIRVNNLSYIEVDPTLDVSLEVGETFLSQIGFGLILSRVRLKALSFGKERIRNDRRVLNVLVTDGVSEAVLTAMDEKVDSMYQVEEGGEFYLEIFRATLKNLAPNVNLFTTDLTRIIPLDDSLIERSIPRVSVKNVQLAQSYVTIEGKVAKVKEGFGEMENIILLEDIEGETFMVVFRGDISDYSSEDIGIGDWVVVYGAQVDSRSLIDTTSPLTLRLRAFSRIERKKY